ncbi:DUF4255 domain-containing protein [Streptomyces sp. KS_5]|uniref:DUF4255 domain-containing protein n=1 Tax=Streptomyces TaxID=1883 RepID=UPI00089801FD|nr:DUF4255 domain-containing protein [Streptomyces sp. KS_5]SEE68640.1 Protein of unknown function [Streptomyces sp. KS_5]
MSNSLAVAAVTATLRARLFARLGGPQVTVAPPDKAPGAVSGDHVNLFLYRADLNPAFRNADPPGWQRGESPPPMLPLVLHYLLAAYSEDEGTAHELLGAAMLALHDHPVLSGDEIRAATGATLPDSDLHLQAEQVKISQETLSQDDIAKMWTAFGTPFRMSSAYQVTAVLIDSASPGSAPLPVLRRGPQDRGQHARPGTGSPALTGIRYAVAGQVAALPGEQVVLLAAHLPAVALTAALTHLRVPRSATVALPSPAAGTQEVELSLPAGLPAGPWAVDLGPADGSSPRTNALTLGIAPQVTALSAVAAGGTPARTKVTVTAAQAVLPGQQAAVLVGARQLAVGPVAAPSTSVSVTGVLPPGTARVRLRVDGVDSEIADRARGTFRTGPTVEVTIP